jgi:hypothetical protein
LADWYPTDPATSQLSYLWTLILVLHFHSSRALFIIKAGCGWGLTLSCRLQICQRFMTVQLEDIPVLLLLIRRSSSCSIGRQCGKPYSNMFRPVSLVGGM